MYNLVSLDTRPPSVQPKPLPVNDQRFDKLADTLNLFVDKR
jgi:hypothetical protein